MKGERYSQPKRPCGQKYPGQTQKKKVFQRNLRRWLGAWGGKKKRCGRYCYSACRHNGQNPKRKEGMYELVRQGQKPRMGERSKKKSRGVGKGGDSIKETHKSERASIGKTWCKTTCDKRPDTDCPRDHDRGDIKRKISGAVTPKCWTQPRQ